MKTVTILRGIPGSGKSTFAKAFPDAVVLSADNYFMRDGVYSFDGSKLADAHRACLLGFNDALLRYLPTIVVDNTNITAVEVAPYAALGIAYGYDVEIITLVCDAEVAARRNIHGVPEVAVRRMAEALLPEAERFPPWWKHAFSKERSK